MSRLGRVADWCRDAASDVHEAAQDIVSKAKQKYRLLRYRGGRAKKRIKRFFQNRQELVQFIKEYPIYIGWYGVLVNYMLFVLAGATFDIQHIIAYGILFYMVKEELREFLATIRR